MIGNRPRVSRKNPINLSIDVITYQQLTTHVSEPNLRSSLSILASRNRLGIRVGGKKVSSAKTILWETGPGYGFKRAFYRLFIVFGRMRQPSSLTETILVTSEPLRSSRTPHSTSGSALGAQGLAAPIPSFSRCKSTVIPLLTNM